MKRFYSQFSGKCVASGDHGEEEWMVMFTFVGLNTEILRCFKLNLRNFSIG